MKLHIGKEIKEAFDNSGLSKAEFARRINKTSQTVYDIFDRETIDTGQLKQIGEVLGKNFFSLYVPATAKTLEKKEEETPTVSIEIKLTESQRAKVLKMVLGEKNFMQLIK